ncbi:hypothetical protein BDV27DRAFT_151696 [Aspergillus caelatus]|uniref:Uncharacterized protein n=1 Tax=Aspergillus caelatus TaxID=61420 RepID=A0A5N7ALS8_9EURO|nr:uncharacterized protein BDV27DRAFT_151696 [Aspergillus caelatus]KAE8370842.1 hypothetical protein BDV27DRAFT_151696 [Aspergillus caelatus]
MASNSLPASAIVQDRLPDLLIGIGHTTNNALHSITFTGTLRPWANFPRDVEAIYLNFVWNRRVVDHRQRSGRVAEWNIQFEQTAVGNETGVQGHWGQHVNQVMSSVFLSQNIDLEMGDFRATTSRYKKVPDMAGASRATGALRLVGELKTPWVDNHCLSDAMHDESDFRHILGGSGLVLPMITGLDNFNIRL